MSIEDRVAMLGILGLRLGVSEDGTRVALDGPDAIVDAALPSIHQHKIDVLFHLRRRGVQDAAA